ncbi:M20/M25/M40 family metallo-hydrolase [Phenylobacterium sp.]|uniref:M20/M25/M40 family metallo-hydrolase n=1 Tax=Phenylobacterium sp. TaxID=1871053 RepID=UPI0035B18662
MRSLCAALALACLAALPAQAGTPRHEKAVRAAAQADLPEFIDFLKIPNVAFQSSANMRRNADWAEAAFKRHGFAARQLQDGDTPMVYAEWPAASPARKTVLFYAHMDGQAVFPKEWDQPDPFVPVLRAKAADGSLQDLPLERLTSGTTDPEWRLFARSAADDKAPILMLIAAMDAVKALGLKPAVNVKVIIDSHEEGGPPTLKDVVARNAELLKADAVVMLDGPMHDTNRPTLVFGHRGGAGFTLTVFGASEDLHSGHYGNFAPNPAFGLARLVTSMKDADGRVLIPGFYEGVAMDAASKAARAAVPDDEAALRARLGIAESEKVGVSYQEAMAYPTLNITEMKAGEPGSHRSIIPSFATASFDSRTVPGTPPARQLALVKAWVQQQGYHLVDGEPTAEERAAYPLLASVKGGGGAPALQTPLDAPVGVWARKALLAEFGQEPVRIPIMGGGVPSSPFSQGLKAPVLLIPLVNKDDNQHAANENLRVGNYFDGARSLFSLVTQPF